MNSINSHLFWWQKLFIALFTILLVGYLFIPLSLFLQKLLLCLVLGLIPGLAATIFHRPSGFFFRLGLSISLLYFFFSESNFLPTYLELKNLSSSPVYLSLGLLLVMTQPLLGCLRWWLLLSSGGIKAPFFDCLNITYASNFFNLFLPGSTGGDILKAYIIIKEKKNTSIGITSTSLDRLIGLPPLLFILFFALLFDNNNILQLPIFHKLLPYLLTILGVSFLFLLYLFFATISQPVTKKFNSRFLNKLLFIHNLISQHAKPWYVLPLCLLISLLAHLAVIISCIIFAHVIGITSISFSTYFILIPLALTINSLPGAPGGIGQGELALGMLLELISTQEGIARLGVLVMILFRLGNIFNGLIGGLIYILDKNHFTNLSTDNEHGN